jgi:hypothetical protein
MYNNEAVTVPVVVAATRGCPSTSCPVARVLWATVIVAFTVAGRTSMSAVRESPPLLINAAATSAPNVTFCRPRSQRALADEVREVRIVWNEWTFETAARRNEVTMAAET